MKLRLSDQPVQFKELTEAEQFAYGRMLEFKAMGRLPIIKSDLADWTGLNRDGLLGLIFEGIAITEE
jgi:hypothetical protein